MNKTKKNGFFIIACLILVLTMLITCAVSATLAMYYSKGNVKNLTVKVATWSIMIGDNDIVEGDANLSGITWTVYSLGEVEEPAEGTIIPGTWGYAEIPIVNQSDVAADITIGGLKTFISSLKNTVTDSSLTNAALDFKVGIGTDASESYGGVEEYSSDTTRYNASKDIFSLTLEKSGEAGDQESIYVYYKWEFELPSGKDTNDKTDTGMIGESFTFGSLAITATQATKSA